MSAEPSTKVAWTVSEWCRDTGICRTVTYEMMRDGRINSVVVGRRHRLIVTTPRDFISSLSGERVPNEV